MNAQQAVLCQLGLINKSSAVCKSQLGFLQANNARQWGKQWAFYYKLIEVTGRWNTNFDLT